MPTNRLMWSAIFSSLSHPCAVINVCDDVMIGVGDMLVDVMLGVDVGLLAGTEIVVAAAPAIILEFMVGTACPVSMSPDVLAVLVIGVVAVIGMLPDENAGSLAAAMAPLEFTFPAPLSAPLSAPREERSALR